MHEIIHYMKNNMNFIYLNVIGLYIFFFSEKLQGVKTNDFFVKRFSNIHLFPVIIKKIHVQIKTKFTGDCFLLRRDLQQKMFEIFIFHWFDKLELYSAYFYFQRCCFSYALGIFETIILFQIFLAHKNKRSNYISKFLYFL